MKLIFRLTIFLLVAAVAAVGVLAQDAPDAETVSVPVGEIIRIQGQVLNSDGLPLAGAVVEIWHTDVNGHYNHPGDSAPGGLVEGFQYFGTATADADGYYAFQTYKPAAYEGRPTHIHVKVRLDGSAVLTTQFYFADELEQVQADGVTQNTNNLAALYLQISQVDDENGQPVFLGVNNLVIDLNGSAADTLAPTPAQTEGPYYPVVDFSGYDNNLTSTATDDALILPLLPETVTFTLLNLNTATAEQFLTIPDMSNRMVREFEEYRPYISIAQFRREIGKYVSAEQVAAYEAYVFVPISVNDSDANTLMQLPGVDETAAAALIAARPFASNDAFLQALAGYVSSSDAALAAFYLVSAS
jgi:protocatechuate 3,4-dioxygenase beta subunit/DNA uptake protein ComE-like DNA-binding protein